MKNLKVYCSDNPIINLDSASYHPISDSVQEYICDLLKVMANPSSSHGLGQNLSERIEEARNGIAEILNCDSDELFFTSGASESFATVMNIWKQLKIGKNRKPKCAIIEHDTIKMSDVEVIDGLFYDNDILMFANNETGEIYERFFNSNNEFFYSDISSAIGNININLHNIKVLSAGFSGEKIGGLSGSGCLYLSHKLQNELKNMNYRPLICGHQEKGMRGGTENVLGILSMYEALKESVETINYKNRIYNDFKNIFITIFDEEELDYIINESQNNLQNILSVSFKNVDAQGLQQYLSNNNVFVGTGAACTDGDNKPSEVLKYIGVPDDYILGTIRFSFHEDNTYFEIKHVARLIVDYFNNLKTVDNTKVNMGLEGDC